MSHVIRFGVIGCGLMGREFAGAAARWCHLQGDLPRPEIVAVCDPNPEARAWFTSRFPSVRWSESDYRALLAHGEIDAVYCAIPHHLHAQVYCDIIRAGKHLMGEKPFGIDQAANAQILRTAAEHPEVVVRCSSEFPFFPACQQLIRWIEEGRFGKLIEVRAQFNHSSDLDLNKPINWKRRVATNGAYGCMGDLGIHTQHVPFRAGWTPESVFAKLSKLVDFRPGPDGAPVPCETWDNATLICSARGLDGQGFPLYLETKRMSPGSTNEWSLTVLGLQTSARFTTDDPNAFYYTDSRETEQAWCRVVIGNKPVFPTSTGSIFEFGFSDSILQMWASFLCEAAGIAVPFGCFRPEETALSHRLQTAALLSHREQRAVKLCECAPELTISSK